MNQEHLTELAAEKNLKIGRISFRGREYFFVKNYWGEILPDDSYGLLYDEAKEFIIAYRKREKNEDNL